MTTITPNTRKLLLDFEVGGGQAYYDRHLAVPSWPGVASGVTIGIGYDLGYNSVATIRDDWDALEPSVVSRLATAAGAKGSQAKAIIGRYRDIRISWRDAYKVFEAVTIPKFSALTETAFPGASKLEPDAFGALLSLVFNRGASVTGPSRREMAAIRPLVKRKDYKGIAQQIRSMKRLWPNVRGLLRRRDAEAALVESVA